jgi:hypothetical protein
MTIVIGPGWTIGGGISILPPPSQPTATWAAGGYPPFTISTVNRITYATDTATASIRGPLVGNNLTLVGTGTLIYGWFGGGYTTGAYISTIQRITYSTDTATATARSTLSNSPSSLAASTDTTTYGWFAGGGVSGPAGDRSTVQRLTFATDTAGTTSRGPLSRARSQFNGTGTSSYGWFGGGSVPASISTVDRIDYANDTATASVRGALTSAVYGAAAISDGSTYGYFVGGVVSPRTSVTQRITFANDTGLSTTRGPYFAPMYGGSGSGNDTHGYVTACNASSPISTVGRITYATDTATASERGPMTYAAFNVASTAGIQ